MPTLRTPLCPAVDIEVPIVQAPVGSVSTPELAAAVADAGGLGLLAMSWRDADGIEASYRAASDRTDGRVGVNVVLDGSTGELPPEACLDACLDAGADIVSLSFGDPVRYIDRIHDVGAMALVTVGTVSEARAAAAAGADGGWLGTRFVATEESGAHEAYRENVADAPASDTRRTEQFAVGWPDQPHRVLADSGPDESASGPVAHTADGDPVEANEDIPPLEGMSGDVTALPQYAGQSVGGVDAVEPAGDVVESLVAETVGALDGAADAVVR